MSDPKKPAQTISDPEQRGNDAQSFVKKLNEKFKDQKVKFRLPNEAEWEYSCRAGMTTAYTFGKTITTQQAHFDSDSSLGTKPVGSFQPNAFGLYDMHGNVYEWCEDYYGAYSVAPTDGTPQLAEQSTDVRVLRSGGWSNFASYCRSGFRGSNKSVNHNSTYGFRVAASGTDQRQ